MTVELKQRVQLSLQRALLGMIYPSIRGIAVGVDGDQFKIVCYLDREPDDQDYENLSDITAEVLADVEFEEVHEQCQFTLAPFTTLDSFSFWAYMRQE